MFQRSERIQLGDHRLPSVTYVNKTLPVEAYEQLNRRHSNDRLQFR